MHHPRSTPQKHYFSAFGIHFCYRLSKPECLERPDWLGKLKKNSFMRSRTRNLQACSMRPLRWTQICTDELGNAYRILGDTRVNERKVVLTRWSAEVAICTTRLSIIKTLHSVHTVHLRIQHSAHNKQRFFIQAALTRWSLQRKPKVVPVRYELNFYILFGRRSVFKRVCNGVSKYDCTQLV
jgi:hypothetical protein